MAMNTKDTLIATLRVKINTLDNRVKNLKDIVRLADENHGDKLAERDREIVRLRSLIDFGSRLVAARAFAVENPAADELGCYRALAGEARKWAGAIVGGKPS